MAIQLSNVLHVTEVASRTPLTQQSAWHVAVGRSAAASREVLIARAVCLAIFHRKVLLNALSASLAPMLM